MAVPVPRDRVLAMLNPSGLPAYDGPRGSGEGVVDVDGEPPARRTGLDFRTCPAGERTHGATYRETTLDGGRRVLADAVVALTGYKGFVPESREAVRLVARDCAYEQRTVTLTFGQRLEVVNASRRASSPPPSTAGRGARCSARSRAAIR